MNANADYRQNKQRRAVVIDADRRSRESVDESFSSSSSGTTYAVKVAPIGGQCNPLEKRNWKRRIGREELNEAQHRTMNRSLKVTPFNSRTSRSYLL